MKPDPKTRLIVKHVLVAAWMLVIFLMSSEVASTSSARSDEIVRSIQSVGINAPKDLLTFLVRKAAHISAYFVLGILAYSLLKEYKLAFRQRILAGITFAMLYAVTDEIHQIFVPGRSGEIRDVIIDTIGATIGIILCVALSRKISGDKSKAAEQPSANKRTNKRTVLVALRQLAALIALLTLFPFVASLLGAGIVPGRYLWYFLPLYAVIVVAAAASCFIGKRQPRGLLFSSVIIVALASLINIGAYMATHATSSLFSFIQQPQVRNIEYSIIAKKGSGVTLASANNAGVISTDQLYKDAISQLSKQTKATPNDFDSLTSIFDSLIAKSDIQIAALRSASLDIVKDANPDLYQSVEVIGTFLVKDTSASASVVDTNIAKPFAVYISGIDTYGSVSTVSRSDVNMLAIINPVTRNVLLVNTPRDYYVQLHGTSGLRDKLTHAGVYGSDMFDKLSRICMALQFPTKCASTLRHW